MIHDTPAARILIIDDDAANILVLRKTLASAGYTAIEGVQNSAEAIDRFDYFEPDLVLLDLHMPHPDGYALLEQISRRIPEGELLPVMVLTADITDEAKERALTLGASDFLTKPFAYTETLLRIRNLLHARDLHQRLQRANRALGNQLAGHESEQRDEIEHRRDIAVRIDKVLTDQSITMVFQPVVNLMTGEIEGAEALARFPVVPIRPPQAWFADAAEVGMDVQLEIAAIAAALRQHHLLPPEAYLAVNASPSTLRSQALVDTLAAHSRPDLVVVELTDSGPLDDHRPLADAMARLRTIGVRIAVDEAGRGYTSLQHIMRLQPDVLKLDRVLIADADNGHVRTALASALVSFSRDIGAVLVAEGIETSSELETLRGLGVEHGQGHLLGRPGPLPFDVQHPRSNELEAAAAN